MSLQTNSNAKPTAQSGKAAGAVSAPIPVPSPVLAPKVEDEAPTFETIRDYFRGKDVVLVSPPGSSFTTSYCSTKKDTDSGTFNCKILDIIIDLQGKPVSAIVEYRERGSRLYLSRDLISLENVYVSSQFKLASVAEVVEDTIAAETATKH